MVLRGLGRRTLYRCNQADEDVYVYYFGDSPKEGAMETGTCTLEIDGEDYYYKFATSGSKKGAGVNGIDDDCIYIQGRRVEAEDGSKYEPYEYDRILNQHIRKNHEKQDKYQGCGRYLLLHSPYYLHTIE